MKCPNCGYDTIEETAILNADVRWFFCRTCEHQWDQTIEELLAARELEDIAERAAAKKSLETKERKLMLKLDRILGYVPNGTKDLLHVLLHPDLLPLTEEYIEAWKGAHK